MTKLYSLAAGLSLKILKLFRTKLLNKGNTLHKPQKRSFNFCALLMKDF